MRTDDRKSDSDFSEPYLTYLDFENKLINYEDDVPKSISEGGGWGQASTLLQQGGLLKEQDFSPKAKVPGGDAAILKQAVDSINKSLTDESRLGGGRKNDKAAWQALVRAELNKAFDVDIDEVKKRSKPLSDFIVIESSTGNKTTLENEIKNWTEVRWQTDFVTPPFTALPVRQSQDKDEIHNTHLRKAVKALNRGLPVILDWFLDLRARSADSSFSEESLIAGANRSDTHFGWHSTVIEDYVVSGVDESTGDEFLFGEGNPVGTADDASEQKRLSETFGEVKYFLIKNSWGGEDFSRSTNHQSFNYIRDMSTGYNRIYANYMRSWIGDSDRTEQKMISGATALIMPREL